MGGSTTYLDDSGNPIASPTYLDDSGNPVKAAIDQTVHDTSASIGPQQNNSFDLGERFRNKVRDIENYTQEGRAEHPVFAALGDALKRIGYTPEPETKPDLSGRGMLAQPIPPPIGDLNLGAIQPSAAAESAAKPGIVSQVTKGEEVAQPQAQEAFRSASQSATPEGASVQPLSIREGLSNPIDVSEHVYKDLYRQIDEAAGTDIKALREKLANTEYQIRQLTDTEADQALEAKLEMARQGLLDKIDDAQKEAVENGVSPETITKADKAFQQTQALKDVEAKVFKNPNVVVGNAKYGTNETVNVNSAIKALQRLEDNTKYGGSRLEQAFGKDAADSLLKNLYEAQRAGQKAVKVQQVAKWLGVSALGAGIFEGTNMAIKAASK